MDVNAFKRSGHREIVLHLISLCLEIRRLFAALENASSKTTVTGPSPTDDILLQPTASTLGQDPMTTTNQINKCLWTFADWLLLPSMLDDAVQRLIITEEDNTNLTHPWFCFLTLPFDGMSIPQVKLVRALVLLIRHFPPINKARLNFNVWMLCTLEQICSQCWTPFAWGHSTLPVPSFGQFEKYV